MIKHNQTFTFSLGSARRVRVLTTVLSVLLIIFVVRTWPDVRDIGFHMVRRLKETLIVK